MFSKNKLTLFTAVVCLTAFVTALALNNPVSEDAMTPDVALQKLMNGNKRYAENKQTYKITSTSATRASLSKGQKPYAIILCCSDSRVPPEIVFDKGLGELFVVRVAGNVVDPIILGSIEYAAEHLGSPLIMVLGHERCGAVTAAADSKGKTTGSENIDAIVENIAPLIKMTVDNCEACRGNKNCLESKKSEFVECLINSNVHAVAESLTKKSEIISHLTHAGKLKIVEAKYDLDTGLVTLLNESESNDEHNHE